MPVLNGYTTLKEIKKQDKLKEMPVIFLTSKNDSDSIVYGFELGAKDYITKPFNTKELEVRVSNHIQIYDLVKKLEDSYHNLEKFIETQDSIVILTDGKELKFANKKLFSFLGYQNLANFLTYYKCVCEHFIENDRFFHLGKINEEQSWVDVMETIPKTERIVSMLNKESSPHVFSISISQYDKDTKIVSFADISETMKEHIELEKKSVHDKLTGAYNREFFDINYKKYLYEYNLEENKLAVALLDIDHFKDVNDTYGHDVGDTVLKEFVNIIHEYSRTDDIFIRWGGEEFILLLKVQSIDGLRKALEHFRKVVEINDFTTIGTKTCSIGGTLYIEDENIKTTIKRADEAVYDAKENGRNKVVIL
jgi:diguanylate cyclase (GGDEF)-like protein